MRKIGKEIFLPLGFVLTRKFPFLRRTAWDMKFWIFRIIAYPWHKDFGLQIKLKDWHSVFFYYGKNPKGKIPRKRIYFL